MLMPTMHRAASRSQGTQDMYKDAQHTHSGLRFSRTWTLNTATPWQKLQGFTPLLPTVIFKGAQSLENYLSECVLELC